MVAKPKYDPSGLIANIRKTLLEETLRITVTHGMTLDEAATQVAIYGMGPSVSMIAVMLGKTDSDEQLQHLAKQFVAMIKQLPNKDTSQ